MAPERDHLTIGEVLSLLREEFPDISISKIRFLESQGLIDPERTPSGYRKFYDHDVERLRWILRQQREHFLPLKVIRGRLTGEEIDEPVAAGSRHRRGGADDPQLPLGLAEAETDPAGPGASSAPPAASEGGDGSVAAPASPPARVGNRADEPSRRDRDGDGAARTVSVPRAAAPDAAGKTDAGSSGAGQEPHVSPPPTPEVPSPAGPGATAPKRATEPAGRSKPAPAATEPSAAPKPPAETEAAARAAADPPAPEEAAEGPSAAARGGGRRARSGARGPAGPARSSRAAAEAQPAEDSPDSYTLQELARAAGCPPELVQNLHEYGLLGGETRVGGLAYFDRGALELVQVGARFAELGVEARHLRSWRNAAEREAGLFEQLVMPLLRQRNPQAREDAAERLEELCRLGGRLRAALVAEAVRTIR